MQGIWCTIHTQNNEVITSGEPATTTSHSEGKRREDETRGDEGTATAHGQAGRVKTSSDDETPGEETHGDEETLGDKERPGRRRCATRSRGDWRLRKRVRGEAGEKLEKQSFNVFFILFIYTSGPRFGFDFDNRTKNQTGKSRFLVPNRWDIWTVPFGLVEF
ncbi:hypothetical protein ACOSQ4_003965 [Xanthoceras sorbifolium]